MWAVVFVFAWFCLMFYGIAYLSTAEKISADVYGAKYLKNRIKTLEDRPVLMEHIHPETNKGFTGALIAVR